MMRGDHHTEETKKRISEALKGRPGKRPTLETRKKISDSGKGRKASKETKEKFSKARMGHITSKETKEKISKTLMGHSVSKETRKKISNSGKGKKLAIRSFEHKENLSQANKGQIPWNKSKKMSSDYCKIHKEKHPANNDLFSFQKVCRIGALKRIQNQIGAGGQICPSYNSLACEWFEKLDLVLEGSGYEKGRYATNGGEYCIKELGYFLDYFNSSAKLIIEWDEPHHYDDHGNLNQKDVQRQSEIQDLYSNFEFRRISQWKEPQLSGARGG